MSTKNDNTTTIVAFFAGAVIGAAAGLLLAPTSGRELRGQLAELGEDPADKVKRLAREAKFRLSPKSKCPDYKYDGGDAWV
ncbi:MAG: hypothetical protein CVU69_05920 [Deltaproteobacteria bacterium HGW-Deltaproteobacteria-4]|nr:MAG: hypothetical protein CVU69_05920 [Deltaproteobacteria bacterium HGW-Deltaproteobacteria-4]